MAVLLHSPHTTLTLLRMVAIPAHYRQRRPRRVVLKSGVGDSGHSGAPVLLGDKLVADHVLYHKVQLLVQSLEGLLEHKLKHAHVSHYVLDVILFLI